MRVISEREALELSEEIERPTAMSHNCVEPTIGHLNCTLGKFRFVFRFCPSLFTRGFVDLSTVLWTFINCSDLKGWTVNSAIQKLKNAITGDLNQHGLYTGIFPLFLMHWCKLKASWELICYLYRLLFFLEEVFFPQAVIAFSLCPLTVTLNAAVILVICKDPYNELSGTAANYFILNLAVCDLLIGFPGELLLGLLYWFPDNHMLRAGNSINQVAFLASILTILGLAVERLVVIAFPFTRVKLATCNRYLCFVAIWSSALILTLPISIKRRDFSFLKVYATYLYDVIGIPITLVVFSCYTTIYIVVKRQLHWSVKSSGEGLLEGQSLTEKSPLIQKIKTKERNVAFTAFILVLLFIACWTPLIVVVNLDAWCSTCLGKFNSYWHYVYCLVFLHPLLNPIAYSLRTARFRKAFKRVIRKSTFWPYIKTMHLQKVCAVEERPARLQDESTHLTFFCLICN